MVLFTVIYKLFTHFQNTNISNYKRKSALSHEAINLNENGI